MTAAPSARVRASTGRVPSACHDGAGAHRRPHEADELLEARSSSGPAASKATFWSSRPPPRRTAPRGPRRRSAGFGSQGTGTTKTGSRRSSHATLLRSTSPSPNTSVGLHDRVREPGARRAPPRPPPSRGSTRTASPASALVTLSWTTRWTPAARAASKSATEFADGVVEASPSGRGSGSSTCCRGCRPLAGRPRCRQKSGGNARTRSPNGLSDCGRRVSVRTSRPSSSRRAGDVPPREGERAGDDVHGRR